MLAGVALGCIGIQARQISDAMMLAASSALSGCVTAEELKDESVLPRIERLRWALAEVLTTSILSVSNVQGGHQTVQTLMIAISPHEAMWSA